jgi:hypothetical protein
MQRRAALATPPAPFLPPSPTPPLLPPLPLHASAPLCCLCCLATRAHNHFFPQPLLPNAARPPLPSLVALYLKGTSINARRPHRGAALHAPVPPTPTTAPVVHSPLTRTPALRHLCAPRIQDPCAPHSAISCRPPLLRSPQTAAAPPPTARGPPHAARPRRARARSGAGAAAPAPLSLPLPLLEACARPRPAHVEPPGRLAIRLRTGPAPRASPGAGRP